MRFLLPVVIACSFFSPLAAQERLQLFPSADVSVIYVLFEMERPRTLSFAWHVRSQRVRIDSPGFGWLLIDQINQTAFLALEETQSVSDIPLMEARKSLIVADRLATPTDRSESLFGLSCTVWSMPRNAGQDEVCLLSDSILLRARFEFEGRPALLEATQVAFAPQDPALFQRPAPGQRIQSHKSSSDVMVPVVRP